MAIMVQSGGRFITVCDEMAVVWWVLRADTTCVSNEMAMVLLDVGLNNC